jgi:nucleoside-triphosphatase THEP1
MALAKLILWVGEKHSGKTTNAFKLAESVRNEGFSVAGLLAPSIYENGRLVGFDAFDLRSKKREPLARYDEKENKKSMYLAPQFTGGGTKDQFIGGVTLGHASLSQTATKSADLIIVDEFGPLELDQRGWRKDVDLLLALSNAIILFIVRSELVNTVKELYKDVPCMELAAGEQDSVKRIVTMLKARREKGIETLTR